MDNPHKWIYDELQMIELRTRLTWVQSNLETRQATSKRDKEELKEMARLTGIGIVCLDEMEQQQHHLARAIENLKKQIK